jgi:nucleoside 2-deoxyribosyltransferase
MNLKGKIYLAGPEVFLPDATTYFEHAKKICSFYGYEGISPFDGEPIQETGLHKADLIFQNNCGLIESVQFVIANCNAFRGALVDDGTAFEIGYAFGLRKKIFGFLDHISPLLENIADRIETSEHDSGYRMDKQGYLVNEDFGNCINLMLEMAIQKSGGRLVEGTLETVLALLP